MKKNVFVQCNTEFVDRERYKHNKITVRTQSLEDSDCNDENSKINNEKSDDEIYDD